MFAKGPTFSVLLLAFILPLYSDNIEWSVLSLWESRYVAEGCDELEAGGLLSTEFSAEHGGFEFGVWAGVGDSLHYQELALTLTYGGEFQNVLWSIGHTHLDFEPGSQDDDEFFIVLETALPLGVVAGSSFVYSPEAEGAFLELSVSKPLELVEERFSLTPYLLYGIDFGYRTETHDGSNHLQLGIECEYTLTEELSLIAYAAHSFALADVRREGLGDISWVGLGLSANF